MEINVYEKVFDFISLMKNYKTIVICHYKGPKSVKLIILNN